MMIKKINAMTKLLKIKCC